MAWNRVDDEISLCRMATREHASKIRLVGILKDACRVETWVTPNYWT